MKKVLLALSIVLSFITVLSIQFLSATVTNPPEAQRAEVVKHFGNLPAFFIENKGQTAEDVKYYFKGSDTVYFTDGGVVFQKTGVGGQGTTDSRQETEDRGQEKDGTHKIDVAGRQSTVESSDMVAGNLNGSGSIVRLRRINGLQRTRLAERRDRALALSSEGMDRPEGLSLHLQNSPSLDWGDTSKPLPLDGGGKALHHKGAGQSPVPNWYRGEGVSAQSLAYRLEFLGANPTSPQARNALQGKVNYFVGNDPSKWQTNVSTYQEIIYPGLYGKAERRDRALALSKNVACDLASHDYRVINVPVELARYTEGNKEGSIDLAYKGVLVPTPRHSESALGGEESRSEESGQIDLVYKGVQGGMKYEFIVRPGANPDEIKLAYTGIDGLSIDESGNLIIHTTLGDIKDEKPFTYQEIDGKKVEVDCRFKIERLRDLEILQSQNLKSSNPQFIYGFEVASYDKNYSLIIDPGLEYSTFLGGSGYDLGYGIAVDSSGNAYVTGFTNSSNFPTVTGAFDTGRSGFSDAFVTKLSVSGSSLVYSTFLGGNAEDEGCDIAIDGSGNAYVTGYTLSSDFPTTPGAFDTSYNGNWDVFVTKLNPTGSGLVYSTFLGGSGGEEGEAYGGAVAVDSSGNTYLTGFTFSSDFPTTPGAFDTSYNGGGWGACGDAFVTKLNPAGSGLIYSTFLGGSSCDVGKDIVIDDSGNAYVTGGTPSSNFPTTPGAFDTSYNGNWDVFVTKLNPAGSGLIYSTFLGGSSGDGGDDIVIDDSGNAYVTGGTSSNDFPTTPGAFDTSHNGNGDIFVTKLNPTGSSLVYSTFLGGSSGDGGKGIAVDSSGYAYVTGTTVSVNFPTTSGAFDTSLDGCGRNDAFVAKLSSTGSSLVYSTFLGGCGDDGGEDIVVDDSGNAYVTGVAYSDFPTTPEAFDTTLNMSADGFVAKLSLGVGEICGNGTDDDGDGLIDCSDPDCFGPGCPEQCIDGQDNDGDGLVDCADPDCACHASCADMDRDGFLRPPCGNDCNDTNPLIHPGAIEVCNDGADNDCDGLVDCTDRDCGGNPACPEICNNGVDDDWDGLADCDDPDCACYPACADADRDGFLRPPCGNDCNDDNPAIHPGAIEVCNDGVDNDCDGLLDCTDRDCGGNLACPEICNNGIDDDWDGLADCEDPDCTCHPSCADADGDGFLRPPCGNDCNDGNPAIHPGVVEVCDDREDNDCDGVVDCADRDCGSNPACPEICNNGIDDDWDGLADCEDPDCTCHPSCADADGDGFLRPPCGDDCNDGDPAIHPGAVEVCDDKVDNDCDGLLDCTDRDCGGNQACPEICNNGIDDDWDGLADCEDPDCTCHPSCADADVDGFLRPPCGNDCNDGNPAIHPGASEVCDDKEDNNCNGLVDCADPDCTCELTCADVDGDGFLRPPCGDDCNDEDPTINPVGIEVCNDGADNDCDGLVDCLDLEDCAAVPHCFCKDNDGDNYFGQSGCSTPVDCNDDDPAINPGTTEICNDGIDNDCDGLVDCADISCCNNPACDEDGDGVPRPPCGNDCNDTNPSAKPGAKEICDDGVDNDCNGLVDCQDPDCASDPACYSVIQVTIDIKPGSFPNSINLKSKGNVPVAILSDRAFDATTVNRNTVVFAGASPLPIGGLPEDVNGDGLPDVVLHFKTQDLTLQTTDMEACLSGETYDGHEYKGCDSVRIVK